MVAADRAANGGFYASSSGRAIAGKGSQRGHQSAMAAEKGMEPEFVGAFRAHQQHEACPLGVRPVTKTGNLRDER